MIVAFGNILGPVAIGFLVVIAAIVIGTIIVYAIKAERERREALARFAAERGLRFSASHDKGHDENYRHFSCFRTGHSRSAYNTVRGTHRAGSIDLDLLMGDFRYSVTTSNGKTTQTTTYHFSFLIAHLPWPGLPSVSIGREYFFHRIGQALGFDDIDFESDEFSRKFLVKGSDKRFVYDVIDPRMMEFLMQSNPPDITIDRSQLLVTSGHSRWNPGEFGSTLAWVDAFLGHWPRHVVDGLERQD